MVEEPAVHRDGGIGDAPGDRRRGRLLPLIALALAVAVGAAVVLVTRGGSNRDDVTVVSESPVDGAVEPNDDEAAALADEVEGPDLRDPAVARDAIEEAFELLYDPNRPADVDLSDLVDDPTGVAAASAASREGPFAEAARHVDWQLIDVQLTGDDRAVVRYALVVPPGTTAMDLSSMSGSAVLHDGRWKATRDTICGDLALGGAPCTR